MSCKCGSNGWNYECECEDFDEEEEQDFDELYQEEHDELATQKAEQEFERSIYGEF